MIKLLGATTTPKKRITMLEEQVVLQRAARKEFVPVKAIPIKGKPILASLREARDER